MLLHGCLFTALLVNDDLNNQLLLVPDTNRKLLVYSTFGLGERQADGIKKAGRRSTPLFCLPHHFQALFPIRSTGFILRYKYQFVADSLPD